MKIDLNNNLHGFIVWLILTAIIISVYAIFLSVAAKNRYEKQKEIKEYHKTHQLRFTSQCDDLDIVLLLDYSGSVKDKGMEPFVLEAAESFVTNTPGRIGIILFNEDIQSLAPMTTNKARLLLALEYLKGTRANGSTDIETALQGACNLLLQDQNGRRKLIILVSDGVVTDGGSHTQCLFLASGMRAIGIGICCVLIKSNYSDTAFMIELARGCYAETDYENLSEELRKLNICL